MVLMFFKAQKMVLQNRFMAHMLLILLGCITWPITLIWLSKHCQDCFWWCGLKVWCNVCTLILPNHLKGIWGSLRLRNSWQQKGTKFSKMWRQGGFWCWTLPKELWLNTKLCLWRWPWTTLQTILNYEHLYDIHIWLGLVCILPLLEFVHALIKFAQSRNVFMCDLVVIIKVCQGNIYNMYCDQTSKFIVNSFWAFKHYWSWSMRISTCVG